jgi:anaerobic magnesium-protoporphyrin IX monomethyl ester cyclase
MKAVWLFPPMGEGFPNVSQYRFYKKMPIRASIIYPYLAASGVTQINKAGHEVAFLDCPTMELTWKNVEKEISDANLVILEGRTPIIKQIWDSIAFIKRLNPLVKVAVYGDHVSWNPGETLGQGADFIIKGGDYDFGAAMLCDALAAGWSGKSKVLSYGLVQNLDSLPWVDRELVNWRPYYESWRNRDVFLWNMGMRGCYYHCVYCAWAETLWQNKIRYRSPENVATETFWLLRHYGNLEILDDSDLFVMHWGVKFAKHLLSMNISRKDVRWSCQTHPDQIRNIEDLKTTRKSGLTVVKLGVESGDDISLQTMKKGSSRKMIEKAILLLKEAGILVHANMMIGFPWETRTKVLDWISWIKKLDPNQAQFSLVIPYPNTELWQMAQDHGWFIQDPKKWELYDASFPMIKMDGLSGEEVVDLYRKCWSSFYLNPSYMWRHLKKVRHISGLKQLWRGFRSIYFGHMKAVDKRKK